MTNKVEIDEQVRNHLAELNSYDSRIRFRAADLIVKNIINSSFDVQTEAAKIMINIFRLDDSPTCDRIIWALGIIGEPAIHLLNQTIRDKTGPVQIKSIYALGSYICDPKLRFESLRPLLTNYIKDVRIVSSSSVNIFAQKIGIAEKHFPKQINESHIKIKRKLIKLLESNMKNKELKIVPFTQQSLDWLYNKF